MKLEKPPESNFNNNKLLTSFTIDYHNTKFYDDFRNGKFNAFLKKVDDHYYYWDELKHQKNIPYNNPILAWRLVKLLRKNRYQKLQFGNEEFCYCYTNKIQEQLHEFDLKMIGGLYKNPITEVNKAEYLRNSVLAEAIASSQVEGAATTTKVAFEMLKSGRKPRNESEQMIFNNMRSIKLITEEPKKELDFQFIIEIHKVMTANTSAEYCAGNFRDKQIYVQDFIDGEIAHTPPDAKLVEKYMDDLCKFANSDEPFIHPIVKASIIHFMIGYIHPFMDGNGRTARALFYWFLIKKEYTLIKNISISKVILNSRSQYDKAFLKTEYDENDLTYFINYSIKSLKIAFENLIKYRDKKKAEYEKSNLISYQLLNKGFNKRQADFIGYLYIKKNRSLNISAYAEINKVSRQTARIDLNELLKIDLIKESKQGRDVLFKLTSTEKVDKFLDY